MPPKPWYRKFIDALVSGAERLEDALSPPPKAQPPAPKPKSKPRRFPFRRRRIELPPEPPPRAPFPPTEPPRIASTDRQRVYEQILEWFPNDGRWETGDEFRRRTGKKGGRRGGRHGKHITMYRSSQGMSRGPANPITVARTLRKVTPQQMRLILGMTREEFQAYARQHGLEYH